MSLWILRTAVAAVAMAVASAACATGGRLNGKGCHNSKRAGYHCHRAQKIHKAPKARVVPAKPILPPQKAASAPQNKTK